MTQPANSRGAFPEKPRLGQRTWAKPRLGQRTWAKPRLDRKFSLSLLLGYFCSVTVGAFYGPKFCGKLGLLWPQKHRKTGEKRSIKGSDGFNRILTGLYFFSPVGALYLWKCTISRGFDRILTGFWPNRPSEFFVQKLFMAHFRVSKRGL